MNIRKIFLGFLCLVIGAALHPLGLALVFQFETVSLPYAHAGFTAAAFGFGALGIVLLLFAWQNRSAQLLWGTGMVAMLGAGALGWWYDYPKASLAAIHRMGAWLYGSTLHEYSDEYIDWATSFTETLAKDPDSWLEAAEAHLTLGDYLLRVGRHHQSIAHFEDAHDLLVKNQQGGELLEESLRWLGIANLRAGEVEFCLHNDSSEVCIFPLQGNGIWRNKSYPEQAIVYFEQLLERNPDDYVGRWLYNYAHMANGSFPAKVREEWRLPESELGLQADAPRFTNRAPQAGIETFGVSGGAIMDDFDGDGLLDLVASCCDRKTPLAFHHNEGNGQFVDWSERAGLEGQTGGLAVIHGDYDNDGDLDLYVLRGAWMGEAGRDRNSLLRNDGDGQFTDVTEESGLGDERLPCLAGAFGDYDNDGDLDLYVGNDRLRAGYIPPSSLWQNNGDGTFTQVSEQAGVTNDRYVRGVSWGDYDNDGDQDLYLSNFNQPNRLYRNDGDGTFTDVGPELGVISHGATERSFPAWFFDVNNDGWLDIFSCSYPLGEHGGKVDETAAGRFGVYQEDTERCRLWVNDGQAGFRDATAEFGLDRSQAVMGANYADIDGDGFQDIYLATGAPAFQVVAPNVLYQNQGGTSFVNATGATGLGHLAKGHGVAFGDIDNDGDIDLYNELGGWYKDSRFRNALFVNDGRSDTPPSSWLTLRLRGVQTNRFGVGCRVRAVFSEGDSDTLREVHDVCGPGASFGSNSLQVELGLGSASRVERLEIYWPVSQQTQVFENLAVNQILKITEGDSSAKVVEVPTFNIGGGS